MGVEVGVEEREEWWEEMRGGKRKSVEEGAYGCLERESSQSVSELSYPSTIRWEPLRRVEGGRCMKNKV